MLKRVAAVTLLALGAMQVPALADVEDELARDLRAAQRVTKGRGATIALLCDGVDPGLREVQGRLKVAPDLVKRTESDQRAGTLLASMLAGTKGVAPAATILSIRVKPSSPKLYKKFVVWDVLGKMATGIKKAVDRGASVILLCDLRGSRANNTMLAEAVDYAIRKKVVVVAPAGRLEFANGKPVPVAELAYPPALPGVIGVGTTDAKGAWNADYSGRNSTVFVAAPGGNVYATGDRNQAGWYIRGGYVAAAWVAGTIALLKAKYPKMSPALIAQALAVSARHHPKGGYDTSLGHGLVNPAGALSAARRLSKLPSTAKPSQQAFGGGPPAAPIKVVKWDEGLLTRNTAIAGGGLLLVLTSLIGALVVIIRRRRTIPAKSPESAFPSRLA